MVKSRYSLICSEQWYINNYTQFWYVKKDPLSPSFPFYWGWRRWVCLWTANSNASPCIYTYVMKMTESFELLYVYRYLINHLDNGVSSTNSYWPNIIRIIRVSDESAGDVLYTRLCNQIHVLLYNCIYMYQVIYFIRSGWIVFCSHMISFQFPLVVSVDLESYMMLHTPELSFTNTTCGNFH